MKGAVDRLRRLDSCAVSDALDKLGLPASTVVGISNLTTGNPVAGRAVTVELGLPTTGSTSTRHLCTAAIEAAGSEQVLVVGHQGRTDCAAWGGNLSRAACARGVAGTLVDGAVRDLDEAHEVGYSVFAAGATPRTARGRADEHSWNTAIDFAGLMVGPDDYVIADRTGIVVVRSSDIGPVLDAAEAIVVAERGIAEAIASGVPVSQAMGTLYERMVARR